MISGPLGQILVGIGMMLAAAVLAFLMTMRLIEPSIGLGFVSFILSLGGIVLGTIGLSLYVRAKRDDED
jgi:hypothetical protein